VACADGLLTSVFSARARARGERVKLVLDPEGCNAFPLTAAPTFSYDEEVTAVMAPPLVGAAVESKQGEAE
jgi:hypothetical protein